MFLFRCKVRKKTCNHQIFFTKYDVFRGKNVDFMGFFPIFPTFFRKFLSKKPTFVGIRKSDTKPYARVLYNNVYMKRIILITGGQRSGKSLYAERLALSLSDNPVYLATAHIWDDEFRQRVIHHQQRRGSNWTNIEEEKALSRHSVAGRVVVIDCITLWCTNFFFDRTVNDWEQPTVDEALKALQKEFDAFTSQDATFIFVTNEIGSGGVSDNAIQRKFTDLEGWMNQYVAERADEVVLMVSGIPVKIKGNK